MKKLFKILFSFFAFCLFTFAFIMPLNPPAGNWYQQFFPNLNGRTLSDVFFLDSLTGWAVTNKSTTDTMFVLKTTNAGDNWFVHYRKVQTGGGIPGYNKIYFLNQNTGYACYTLGFDKTTNGGGNWTPLIATESFQDMSILSVDTIWLASANPLTGGVFRTTNGGSSWQNQFSGGNQNPNKIYMYNARIGFMSNNSASPNIYKTTNSGVNWNIQAPTDRFIDMHFVDSLTGWRTRGDTLKFTSNGGLNWTKQLMPYGGMIFSSNLGRFSVLNKDTLWGCCGYVLFPNSSVQPTIYRTTNGGINWLYQLPDTSFLDFVAYIQFIDKNHGWLYGINTTGIHTTNGGDTNWLTPLEQISSEVPKQFLLYQNYPNPFNPKTNIKYQITNNNSNVKLVVFNIQGKQIAVLVNQKQSAGTYEVDWNAADYPSGVYFFTLSVEGNIVDTKKMILVK